MQVLVLKNVQIFVCLVKNVRLLKFDICPSPTINVWGVMIYLDGNNPTTG